jgi:putative ABC transport system permease protein
MWMLFLGEMKRRWLEYALGTAAVALVVGALVTHRALTTSAEGAIHDLAHRLGRNMLVVPAATDLAAFHAQRFGAEAMPESVQEDLRSSDVAQHLGMMEARLYGNVAVEGGEVIVVGQELGWPKLGDVEPVVVGAVAARVLGVNAGSPLRLGGASFSVLQVADAPPDGLDRAVFMPLAAAQRVLGRPGEISALRLGGCWCRIDVATLAGQIQKLLPGTRAVTVAGMIQAQKGSVATMQRYSGVLHATGVGVVALVVAALVASQARRRRREIGLLTAIGAPPGRIARLLTLQAALAGALGGLAGWLGSVPAVRKLGLVFLEAPLSAPGDLLVPSVLLAAGVSAIAAAIPAYRAASLDPTVVLRES